MQLVGEQKMVRHSYFIRCLFLVSILNIQTVSAATKVLSLLVSGTIAPSPEWQDDTGAPITSMNINFSGLMAGTTAAVAVDSPTVPVKLIASTYPASVALVRPAGCAIGVSAVNNNNVHFMMNNIAITTNSNINIPNANVQSFGLRFAAAGNHGNKSGAVNCSTAGTLTYTY
jgi:hypothetical protein